MKPTTVTVTAASGETTATNWVCMDRFPEDTEVSFGVTVTAFGSGAAYSVQHTFVNVPLLGTAAASSDAIFDHPTVSGQTGAADGNYDKPIAAVRLQVVGGSASGNIAAMTITQTGN